jgi:hypothetical protein
MNSNPDPLTSCGMYRPQDKGGATLRDRVGVLNWQKDDGVIGPERP